jgi:hypothetical protein
VEAAMTDYEKEARERLVGVTPGPWTVEDEGGTWLEIHSNDDPNADTYRFSVHCNPNSDADAAFIAWCREGVPALLAMIEELRAEVRLLTRAIAVLEEALEPFAACADMLDEQSIVNDDTGLWLRSSSRTLRARGIYVRDVRRARAVLANRGKERDDG